MAEAELKIKRLKEEGWIVETGRTFMGEKGDLASMAPAGMDLETVPVASWEGQQIVFVAFRKKTAPVVPPVTQQQAPQSPVKTTWDPSFTSQKAAEAFYTTGGGSQIENDNGFLVSPDNLWGFILRDAQSPANSDYKDMVELGRRLAGGQAVAIFNNCDRVKEALQEAMKQSKDVIDFMTPAGVRSSGGIKIEFILKTMETLGGGDIRVVQETGGPAFFANHHGDMAVLCFSSVDENKPEEQEIVARYSELPLK